MSLADDLYGRRSDWAGREVARIERERLRQAVIDAAKAVVDWWRNPSDNNEGVASRLESAVDALDGKPVEALKSPSVCVFCFALNLGSTKYRMCCGPGRASDMGPK